jgi:protease I
MKPLSGTKIAVLIANGFDETNFISVQKSLIEMGATVRLVSSNQGLVNGWDGAGWGHNYAVDEQLNTALGADYDALVVPGGRRSTEKLKLTAHTRRFIGSFMASRKPVAVMGDGVTLMALTEQLAGHEVTGPEDCREECERAGAVWAATPVHQDERLLTGACSEESMGEYFSTMRDLFMQDTSMKEAA